MLLPPTYRIGSAPFVWIKTQSASYIYLVDVDPERQVFALSMGEYSVANAWQLFGQSAWLEGPIGVDSMNLIVSSSPLSASLESAIINPQNYDWSGQYYILNSTIQQQLVLADAEYLYQGYEITN